MRSSRWRAVAVGVAACAALAGCNDDGRTLEPTSATMPPTEVPPTTTTGDAVGFGLTSPDVVDGGELDPSFTCDGAGRAPTVEVSGAPPAAAELAVAVVDLDAADFVHLAAAGLPITTSQVVLDQLPAEAVLARTDSDVQGWAAPCPPTGDAAHRYEIRVYAAAEPIGLTPGLPGREAVELMETAALDVARLPFTYEAAA